MPYRTIVPGQKVKASDMQLAINQGVLQFPSSAERSAAVVGGNAFEGMLTRILKASRIDVYGTRGSSGWVPFGLVPLGVTDVDVVPVPTGGTGAVVKFTTDVFYDFELTSTVQPPTTGKLIFEKDGTINCPWPGIYLLGYSFSFDVDPLQAAEPIKVGDRWSHLSLESGNGYHYGVDTESVASNKGSQTFNSMGVVTTTVADTKWNLKAFQDSDTTTLNIRGMGAPNRGIGLYLLSSRYAAGGGD